MSSITHPNPRIEGARRLVLEILEGRMSPDTHQAAFEEDTVFLALWILLRDDNSWLEIQLSDDSYPLAKRDLVRRLLPQPMN